MCVSLYISICIFILLEAYVIIRNTTLEYIESNSAFRYIPAVPVELSGIWSTASQIYTMHC